MPVWKKILCAIDFSAPSRVAMLQAAELAASHHSELLLLHVREVPGVRAQLGMMPFPPEAYDAETSEAWRQLERASRDAGEIVKARVATEMVEGPPVEHIARFAQEHRVDVIVVGTHGRTGVRRAVLGSVAEHLVRHAPCSVLVVRPEELVEARPD